ncbi:DNA-binding protein Fis [Striga asiatica]|uniref:DNA-binding protein Fis n=1 Tax=Striga asiatica TaxID=4170 RepID=A0A5A7PW65_STRAF|nr:DNA-binding protein Fis [Striga asiatica]
MPPMTKTVSRNTRHMRHISFLHGFQLQVRKPRTNPRTMSISGTGAVRAMRKISRWMESSVKEKQRKIGQAGCIGRRSIMQELKESGRRQNGEDISNLHEAPGMADEQPPSSDSTDPA